VAEREKSGNTEKEEENLLPKAKSVRYVRRRQTGSLQNYKKNPK
jgi:hypothetical protein